jgi:hypothetical protein
MVAGGVAGGLALSAAPAGATLVYSTGGFVSAPNPGPQWVWSARDNGSAPRRLARGAAPSVSPSGRLVAYWALAGTDIRLTVVRRVGRPAQGLSGRALSRDGAGILATSGRPMPKDSDVLAVPYTCNGGRGYRVLVRPAASPRWNATPPPR